MDTERLQDIPGYRKWIRIERIYKGWSEDEKYFLQDREGRKLLLRIADIELYSRKKKEYECLIAFSQLNIQMNRPVTFGVCNAGSMVYLITTWLEGEEARDIVPRLKVEEQYLLGREAGRILRKMHSLPTPGDLEPWEERYGRKIDNVLERYKADSSRIGQDDKVIKHINENKHLLQGREQALQHGDFHLGSMIMTNKGQLGIIDFNRCSYGDPWEEYDRYIFTWQVSVPFAVGQIHGYFLNQVPDDFFKLMSLYNATNILASLPWAEQFGQGELNFMLQNAEQVIRCYDYFKRYVPSWYEEPEASNKFF